MKDTLYKSNNFTQNNGTIAPFEFNAAVAQVFDDMIKRSVPGYGTSIELAAVLANHFCDAGDQVYDLGCSLGACTLAILNQASLPPLHINAIDFSQPMLNSFKQVLSQLATGEISDQSAGLPHNTVFNQHQLTLELADITDYGFQKCTLVLLNYVLQFIAIDQRSPLLQAIYTALMPGGALLLSEKLISPDPVQQTLMTDLHLGFKKLQGYSELEINNKRTALVNSLIPETLNQHIQRLKEVGFSQVLTLGYHLNFTNLLAIK